jgi:pimeloyl-ACP methyl ester carboxylesterase
METVEEVDTGDVRLSCVVAGGGPVVLAMHGFPDCRESFRPILPALVGAGFRVVLPALRGYAPSGVARSGRHDARRAGEDAIFLADHFSPGAPVRLIGHDWGAVAAFVAAGLRPERWSHLGTLAVPHPAAFLRALLRPAQLRRSWYMGLFQLPGIAERRLAQDDLALVDRLWRDWSPGYAPPDSEMRAVKDAIRGRIGPVLAYYRGLRSPRAWLESRAMLGPIAVPAIHVHGDRDGCIGIESTDGAERHYARGYRLHRVAGAGHFLVQERPAEVAELLLDFLGRPAAPAAA